MPVSYSLRLTTAQIFSGGYKSRLLPGYCYCKNEMWCWVRNCMQTRALWQGAPSCTQVNSSSASKHSSNCSKSLLGRTSMYWAAFMLPSTTCSRLAPFTLIMPRIMTFVGDLTVAVLGPWMVGQLAGCAASGRLAAENRLITEAHLPPVVDCPFPVCAFAKVRRCFFMRTVRCGTRRGVTDRQPIWLNCRRTVRSIAVTLRSRQSATSCLDVLRGFDCKDRTRIGRGCDPGALSKPISFHTCLAVELYGPTCTYLLILATVSNAYFAPSLSFHNLSTTVYCSARIIFGPRLFLELTDVFVEKRFVAMKCHE